MAETLACGYSYENTQHELSNEYKHDRFLEGFQGVIMLRMKVALALEGLLSELCLCNGLRIGHLFPVLEYL